MNVYTDPSLLDVAGALAALPELSLEGAAETAPESRRGLTSAAAGGKLTAGRQLGEAMSA